MQTNSQLTDNDLFQRLRRGDEGAFTEIYRRRQGAIYRFALQMTGNPTLAEEATQEVFLAVIQDTARFDPRRGSLKSFLYGLARNHVLRHAEREGRYAVSLNEAAELGETRYKEDYPNNPESYSSPLANLTRSEILDRVQQAVMSLPPKYREVVVLCDLHEQDYTEAAQALGCAVGTVRSRLHRARGLLLKKLTTFRETSAGLSAGVK